MNRRTTLLLDAREFSFSRIFLAGRINRSFSRRLLEEREREGERRKGKEKERGDFSEDAKVARDDSVERRDEVRTRERTAALILESGTV